MRAHPDLSNPVLPDAEEDLPIYHRSRSTLHAQFPDDSNKLIQTSGNHQATAVGGGQNVNGEFEWPEAGPSSSGRTSSSRLGAKAAAAITGAVVTSLLMTPFDVLKTRLQTAPPHSRETPIFNPNSAECCQTTVLSPNSSRFKQSNPLTCITSPIATSSTIPSSSALSSRTTFRPPTEPAAPPSGCLNPSKWAGIWGETITYQEAVSRGVLSGGSPSASASGGVGTLVMPRQIGSGWSIGGGGLGAGTTAVTNGFWTEVGAVWKDTGIKGLWKGVGTTLTMSIPSAAIYMIGYENLLVRISPFFTGSSDPSANISAINRSSTSDSSNSLTAAPLVAGSLARTFSATVISPIEMFRTRLQALPSVERGSPTYASTGKEMVNMVKSKGVAVLWRGLGPTLWRDVPFSGLYWAGFEIIKTKLSSSSSPLPPMSPLGVSFLSGALSGTLSALLTQPFDVLKTRRQVFTPSPTCSPEAIRHRASTLPLALHVIRTEGWGALFAGVVPRCGKVAPACGLMIACYEGVGRYLGGEERD